MRARLHLCLPHRYLFGSEFYAGCIRGTYRKQQDWYRVLFDDGANLTVHLDPSARGSLTAPSAYSRVSGCVTATPR